MMNTASLPYSFWAEVVYTATYIRNRCVSRALSKECRSNNNNDLIPGNAPDNGNDLTPEQLWSETKPDISHLRIFESEAYILEKGENRHKFESKADKHIFLGYDNAGYRLWNPQKQRVVISRNITFKEKEIRV